jgi:hypothetical protein
MRHDKNIEGSCISKMTNYVWGRNVDNGWYFVLRLRFLSKIRTVVDPYFFEEYTEYCYPIVSLMVRRPTWATRFYLFKALAWIPTDDWRNVQLKYNRVE